MSEEKPTAVVKYEPLAPIKSVANLRSLLERQKDSLLAVLPKHVTPERLLKTLFLAVNRQPDLLECTQSSLMDSVNRAAELGLDLSGTLGEAYLVPRYNTIKWRDDKGVKRSQKVRQACFQPGYRGLAKLARQSGEIGRIEAEVVYQNDHFLYQKGAEFKLEFRPLYGGDRGKVLGAYSMVEFKDGGIQSEFMTFDEIEAIRKAADSPNSPAWVNHWGEMGKKTVFRRLAKWLPLSGEKWTEVIAADNESFDLDAVTLPVQQVVKTADLLGAAEPVTESEDPEPGEVIDASWTEDTETEAGPKTTEPKKTAKSKPLSKAKVKAIDARIAATASKQNPADVYHAIKEVFGVQLAEVDAGQEAKLEALLETEGV